MPVQVWLVILTFAALCTFYCIRVRDKNNYTDAIAGLLAVIFWILSGLSLLGGIQTEYAIYSSAGIMWVFIAIGIIVAIITFVRILDIVAERDRNKNHVHFGQIKL